MTRLIDPRRVAAVRSVRLFNNWVDRGASIANYGLNNRVFVRYGRVLVDSLSGVRIVLQRRKHAPIT